MPIPDTTTMIRELVEQPSVSCVSKDCDMGNLGVVEKLVARKGLNINAKVN